MNPDYKGIIETILNYLDRHKWQARCVAVAFSVSMVFSSLAAFLFAISYVITKFNGV